MTSNHPSRAKRYLIYIATVITLLNVAASAQKPLALKYYASTEKMIKHLKANIPRLMDQALIPGLSLAVIHEGDIIWQAAFGVKNSQTREPVTMSTVFEAASLSKPVFTYGVMKLVQEKILDLDKPLLQYLPREELIKVYPKADTTDKRLGLITARMVLTHSTGFPNWFGRRPMSFLFTPGERFVYSGEAFSLLGQVVAKLSGMNLTQFTRQKVLDPLGMKNSSYVWLPAYDQTFSGAHNTLGRPTPTRKAPFPVPGASLYTTAGDYARFLTALLNHQGLSQEIVEEMLKPQITALEKKGETFYWGLGIGINPSDRGVTAWHWGDNGNFKAYFEVLIKEKTGVVFFTNSSNGQAISKDLVTMTTGIQEAAIAKNYFSYPHYTSPTLQLPRIYIKKGVQAALKYVRGQLAATGNGKKIDAAIIRNLARGLVEAKRIEDCLAFLRSGVKMFPKSHALHQILGAMYLIGGNNKQGQHHLQTSLTLKPRQENELNSLGYTLLAGRYYPAALAVFKLNVATYPQSANCYDSLAEAYMRAGNREMAIKYYQLTLEKIPLDTRASKTVLASLKQGAEANLKQLKKKQ